MEEAVEAEVITTQVEDEIVTDTAETEVEVHRGEIEAILDHAVQAIAEVHHQDEIAGTVHRDGEEVGVEAMIAAAIAVREVGVHEDGGSPTMLDPG